VSTDSLLPPNATALETGLARLGARLSDIAIPIADLWNPQTCPLAALPWLAWTLSIDKWDTDWTEERKRAATAGAIAAQRRKGSVASVRAVLRGIDDLLELVEGDPALAPHRFTVRMPVADEDGTLGGPRLSAQVAAQIVADVLRVAPVRSQLNLVIDLALAGALAVQGAARAAHYRRLHALPDTSGINWAGLLTNETGEPLTDDHGQFIDAQLPEGRA
jgi:phage tail P2-like protein